MNSEREQIGWRTWIWWVGACTVGFAAGSVVGHDAIPAVLGAAAPAVEEIVHGAVFGAITGVVLINMFRRFAS